MKLFKRLYFNRPELLDGYYNYDYITIKHPDKLFINLYYKTYRKFENESFEDCAEIGTYDTVTYFQRRNSKW